MKVWLFSIIVAVGILEVPPAFEVAKKPAKYCKANALPAFPLAWLTCKAMNER